MIISMTRGGRSRRHSGAVTLLAVTAAALAACSSGGETSDDSSGGDAELLSQEEIDEAMSTPTDLLFWTWVPDIENEVALFEAAYPEIDVEVVNAGQGLDQYSALRNALSAGEGVPDVAQIEFQYIPGFSITDSLLDLRPYGAGEFEDAFVDWTWAQVSGPDGEVFAYPQDTGPMGMLYREDIFASAGIEPPTTWEEFAEAARTLHQANPDVYMTNLAPNDPGQFFGLSWQAGAEPFTAVDAETIGVTLTDEPATRVTEYWQGLVQEGVVSVDPDFTDQWYQGLNRGTYATWLTAAWGPVFLASQAQDTSGLWRAAPLPQWEDGDEVSGNWGGSTSAVMAESENPIAAAKLAEFINTDEESTRMLATEQFLYPATTALLEDPEFLGQESEFYGGQQVNRVFADISETVDTDFSWSPIVQQVYTDWNETVGTAFAESGDAVGALEEWQGRAVSFAEQQGFTVQE